MDIKRFLIVVGVILILLSGCGDKQVATSVEPVKHINEVAPSIQTTKIVDEPLVEVLPETKIYRVTAYCPCEICCGEWAKNRPLNESGEPIVVGAWNTELVSGFSCASPMAFGTQVELEGIGTVEVQDRTAKWVVKKYGEDIIDIYMTDHDAAWEFGEQYIKGVIK